MTLYKDIIFVTTNFVFRCYIFVINVENQNLFAELFGLVQNSCSYFPWEFHIIIHIMCKNLLAQPFPNVT